MKIKIQCAGCEEKFKFVVEPGMTYDFVCPQCNTEQSFETPGAAESQTQEIPVAELPAEAAPSEAEPAPAPEPEPAPAPAPEPAADRPKLGLRPEMAAKYAQSVAKPAAPAESSAPPPQSQPKPDDKYVPPPKKEYNFKRGGKEKAASIMKWTFRLILLAIIGGIGWAVWVNFLDPGGKIAWQTALNIKSFDFISKENGKIKFRNGAQIMSLTAETGEVTTLATLPEFDRFPFKIADCGQNRGIFVNGSEGKFYGFTAGDEVALMDYSGKKAWERKFIGRVSSVNCGDDVVLIQSVEAVYRETRDSYDVYDHFYRVNAVSAKDGTDLWTKGPEKNTPILHSTLTGGKMMITQSWEVQKKDKAEKPKTDKAKTENAEDDDDDDDEFASGRQIVLTAAELADGKPKWRLRTPDYIDWGPFILGDTLIFKQKNKLSALNITDGKRLWELNAEGYPQYDREDKLPNVVYFSSRSGIAALDLKSGKELWKNSFGADPMISSISDKYLFLGSRRERTVEVKESDNKLPPAYEKLKKEEPDLFGGGMAETSGTKTKVDRGIICIDAATGKQLWDVHKIFGQVVAEGNRIVLFWDSADTTTLGGMGFASSNRAGKTVIHQYSAKSGRRLFNRNDEVAIKGPFIICGKKFVALYHSRAGGPDQAASGIVAFNLK